jgi:hypothetical protein
MHHLSSASPCCQLQDAHFELMKSQAFLEEKTFHFSALLVISITCIVGLGGTAWS